MALVEEVLSRLYALNVPSAMPIYKGSEPAANADAGRLGAPYDDGGVGLLLRDDALLPQQDVLGFPAIANMP